MKFDKITVILWIIAILAGFYLVGEFEIRHRQLMEAYHSNPFYRVAQALK